MMHCRKCGPQRAADTLLPFQATLTEMKPKSLSFLVSFFFFVAFSFSVVYRFTKGEHF